MNVKDVLGKVSGIIGKLPFVKLAEKIPEGARTKLPFLNALVPLANHIASGLAVVVLVACLQSCGGGGLANTTWQASDTGNIYAFDKTTFASLDARTGYSFKGTYTISGKKVIITYDHDGSAWEWSLSGGSLINDVGTIFVKIPNSSGDLAGTKWVGRMDLLVTVIATLTFGNGTFVLSSDNPLVDTFSGTYEVHSNTLMYKFDDDGTSGTTTIFGNTMVFDKIIYTKQ